MSDFVEVFNDLAAGGAGGICGILVGSPFDVVKTRQQAYGGGTISTVQNIIKNEGFKTFYRGILPPIVANVPLNALFFASYGFSVRMFDKLYPQAPIPPELMPKPTTQQQDEMLAQLIANGTIPSDTKLRQSFIDPKTSSFQHNGQQNVLDCAYNYKTAPYPNFTNLFLAGCASGFWGCFVLVPVELLKIKEQNYPGKVPSSLHILKDVLRIGGLRGLFQGYWATFFRDVPSVGVYFGVYEWVKWKLRTEKWQPSYNATTKTIDFEYDIQYTAPATLAAGSAAGVASWCSTYPMDFAKTRIQNMPFEQYKKEGTMKKVFTKAIQERGFKALWSGIVPTILRAAPVNASIFFCYEQALSFLRSTTTTSVGNQVI